MVKNGNSVQAISAGHEVTQEVAREILKDGGNAFDAAISAYAAACIAEPCMASAGAGGVALLYENGKAPYILDFFCQTPKQKQHYAELDFFPIPVDFGDAQETYYGGLAAMAVPGAIAGLFELHDKLATRPMRVLLEPAIALAKAGVPINNFQHYDLSLLNTIFDHQPRAKELFKPNGELINIGENLCLPHFADFLDYLGNEGPNAFYQGEVAQKIASDCKDLGGYLSLADLKEYQTIYRQPNKDQLKRYSVYSNPLPAIGGPLLSVGLNILNESNHHHLPSILLECFYAMEAKEKSPKQLASFLQGRNRRGATSHFNIVDRWGNAIALTMTVGEGSGYFIPGTDIHMNNMLGEQSLVPNGWHSWKTDTRLSTMMCPTMAFDQENSLQLVAGSGGASRIPGAIMQVLRYRLLQDLPLRQAVAEPRLHLEYAKLDMEPGLDLPPTQIPEDLPVKIWGKNSMFFGGVHCIARDRDSWAAVGDGRRDGLAWVG